MPRTREDLERAATDAEKWLDSLDPDITPAQDARDLRDIAAALRARARAETELETAVRAARDHGHSWTMIALALGVSRQAARQRYGEPAHSA